MTPTLDRTNSTPETNPQSTSDMPATPGTGTTPTLSLIYVDPRELILEHNVRTDVDLVTENPDFLASIRTHGVQSPPLARRNDDGDLVVVWGHSRVRAAVLAVEEHPSMPLLVTTADIDDTRRIVEQLVENLHRSELGNDDVARAVEELVLFGLSSHDIARALSTTEERVSAAVRVRQSRTGAEVIRAFPQLDFLQLAALAEFEDDDAATTTLCETLDFEPEQFDHEVSRLRLRRERENAQREMREQLSAEGLTVLDSYDRFGPAAVLADLWTDEERGATMDADPSAHEQCPGHAAVVETDSEGVASAVYLCRDWAYHEHTHRYRTAPGTTGGPNSSGNPGYRVDGQPGGLSEHEKGERKRARVNNEKWDAAQPVRRKWLREFLARTSAPKGVHQFLAREILACDESLSRAAREQHPLACTLLGLPAPKPFSTTPHPIKLTKATNTTATRYSLAIILAAYEDGLRRDSWRSPDGTDKRYLQTLKTWGYALSPVERLALDPAADAQDWPHLRAASTTVDAADASAGAAHSADPVAQDTPADPVAEPGAGDPQAAQDPDTDEENDTDTDDGAGDHTEPPEHSSAPTADPTTGDSSVRAA